MKKRFFEFLIGIILLVNCVYNTVYAGDMPQKVMINAFDYQVSAEGVFVVVDAINCDSKDIDGHIFVVLYDNNNKMLGVKAVTADISAKGEKHFEAMLETDFFDVKSVKLKLLLLEDTIKPLADYDIEFIDNTL